MRLPERLNLCRASVEKVYRWKEERGASRFVLLGLIEVWAECPINRSKGHVYPQNLSPTGQDAYKELCYFRTRLWI